MASVDKLPSGNYRVRVYDKKNKKTVSFTAPTKAEAKRKAAEWEYQNDDTRDLTIEECLSRYLENRSNVLSPSTIRGYYGKMKLLEPMYNYSAKILTSETVQFFINDLCETHSPKTAKDVLGLLTSAVRAFYPNKNISVRLPQAKVSNSSVPTSYEVELLLESANQQMRKAIILASIGTLRRGEIAALTYGDIQGNTIHVHADIVQDEKGEWVYKNTPKTSASDRYIQFPDEAIRELGTGEPDERIVNYKTPDSITGCFVKLRKRLKINCRFHDLRHYSASISHAIGIPDQYVMARGGWRSDKILKEVYRNVLDDERKLNEKKINDYFSKTFFGDNEETEEKPSPTRTSDTVRNLVGGNKSQSCIYSIWSGMKSRCYNPNSPVYGNYGGRGITICDEWKNDSNAFIEWAYANGYKEHLTIDRIDINGNYEPGNCRFITLKENIKAMFKDYSENKKVRFHKGVKFGSSEEYTREFGLNWLFAVLDNINKECGDNHLFLYKHTLEIAELFSERNPDIDIRDYLDFYGE